MLHAGQVEGIAGAGGAVEGEVGGGGAVADLARWGIHMGRAAVGRW